MEGQTEASTESAAVTQTEATQTETTQQTENTQTENDSREAEKPSGFDRVEFTPEQKARVDRIYGNMKRYENDAKELREHNQRLIDAVNQLSQGQQQIVSHIQGSNYQEAESRLEAEQDAAWNKGDYQKYKQVSKELNKIQTQRLLAETQAKNQPQTQQNQQQVQRGVGADALVNRAVESKEMSPEDANIANSWMSESDASGNLKRPWTIAGDPRNYEAGLVGAAVFNSPQWANRPIADKFREIDRRMGIPVQQNNSGQNVLGSGNLTRGKQTNNITLSPEIEKLAIRTKFGGPKAKSDQDHINAWKQAVLKSQTKGARR